MLYHLSNVPQFLLDKTESSSADSAWAGCFEFCEGRSLTPNIYVRLVEDVKCLDVGEFTESEFQALAFLRKKGVAPAVAAMLGCKRLRTCVLSAAGLEALAADPDVAFEPAFLEEMEATIVTGSHLLADEQFGEVQLRRRVPLQHHCV